VAIARVFIIVLLAVALGACGGNTPRFSYDAFREAFDAGAPCADLFRIRNEADPKDPDINRMNEDLGSIGCFSNESIRQDPRTGGTDLYSINYKSSYTVCFRDPDETYRQAGTRDPEEAAVWLSEGTRAGEAYEGSYQGCLDALNGKPNRFEQ
jgi:hypothetical protein